MFNFVIEYITHVCLCHKNHVIKLFLHYIHYISLIYVYKFIQIISFEWGKKQSIFNIHFQVARNMHI